MNAATEFYCHPTAVIEEGVTIGSGTNIWLFTHIMQGAVIGKNCNIGQNVYIDRDVLIGDGVKIQNNVSLYTGVTCEDEVFIGPSAVFTNVINPRSAISRKDALLKTIIRKGATIGANATIVCGNTIGTFAFIAAGAVVTRDVQPNQIITGNPGKPSGWMSDKGTKLIFDEKGFAFCPESGTRFKLEKDKIERIQ